MQLSKLGRWCPGARKKHLKLAMASRRAAFSGNTWLIATFSSCYILLTFISSNQCFMFYLVVIIECMAKNEERNAMMLA